MTDPRDTLKMAEAALEAICDELQDDDAISAAQIARHAGREAIASIRAALAAQEDLIALVSDGVQVESIHAEQQQLPTT